MKRSEAKAIWLPRYHGKVCKKHPDMMGERYTANWGCVRCRLQSSLLHSASPAGKNRISTYIKTPDRRKWRKQYRQRDYVRASESNYEKTEKARKKQAELRATTARKRYQHQYRSTPEQKAKRALRSRMFEQHISKRATPTWAIPFFIGEIYHLAQLRTKVTGLNWEVDHIVPMMSDLVCGLHVETNLRVVPSQINRQKSNKLIHELIG